MKKLFSFSAISFVLCSVCAWGIFTLAGAPFTRAATKTVPASSPTTTAPGTAGNIISPVPDAPTAPAAHNEKTSAKNPDEEAAANSDKDLKENLDQGLKIQKATNTDHSKEIQGFCEVVKSSNNPFKEPCVTTLLILKDTHGKEVARTRTDSKGRFGFAVAPDQKFTIQPDSASYEVVSPKTMIASGSAVHLRLLQKAI